MPSVKKDQSLMQAKCTIQCAHWQKFVYANVFMHAILCAKVCLINVHSFFLISNLSRAHPSKLLNKCAIFHYFGPNLPYKYMFKLLLGTSTIFLWNNFLKKKNNLENSYQIRKSSHGIVYKETYHCFS